MADVIFKRKTSTEIASLPIVDGSVIFNTTDKGIFMDNGTTRERYGGGNLSKSDVVNNLASTSINLPLSANQGNVLNTKKIDKSSVVNDVATAVSVTATNIPAGCGCIKELNQKTTKKYLYTRDNPNRLTKENGMVALNMSFIRSVSSSNFTFTIDNFVPSTCYPKETIFMNMTVFSSTLVYGSAIGLLDVYGSLTVYGSISTTSGAFQFCPTAYYEAAN